MLILRTDQINKEILRNTRIPFQTRATGLNETHAWPKTELLGTEPRVCLSQTESGKLAMQECGESTRSSASYTVVTYFGREKMLRVGVFRGLGETVFDVLAAVLFFRYVSRIDAYIFIRAIYSVGLNPTERATGLPRRARKWW